jgi:MinD-like ATPase involved in chromosome partitioning or flagellar assembly
MTAIISIHSFRRGAGKSMIAANTAAALALAGARVGIVDANLPSPSMHVLFNLAESDVRYTFNDFLRHRCDIEQTAVDVTRRVSGGRVGHLYLTPSSFEAHEIVRATRDGYDVDLLHDGFRALAESLRLDMLVVDTNAGLGEETLLLLALADSLVVVLRPDQRDYQGTGVIVDVARRLELPRVHAIVNEVPTALEPAAVTAEVERIYRCGVIGVLPHDEIVTTLPKPGIVAVHYPSHPITATFRSIAARLIEEGSPSKPPDVRATM